LRIAKLQRKGGQVYVGEDARVTRVKPPAPGPAVVADQDHGGREPRGGRRRSS
jgi:hypothetical protein